MKSKANVVCAILVAAVLLPVLSGCGKVDKGLIGEVETTFVGLKSAESGGWRRETYLSTAEGEETLSQSAETWFRLSGEDKDWYIGTFTYGDDGAVQMNSELAQKSGVQYQRSSIGEEDAVWKPLLSVSAFDGQGFPDMELMDDVKHYEFFRKEADGSFTFTYSQAGLEAYHAMLVAQTDEQTQISAELDGQPVSEEVRASMEQNRTVNMAVAEQSKITALSGVITLDEAGNIRSYETQITGEAPELGIDKDGNWVAVSTRSGSMRMVIEILSYSDTAVVQKLTELFVQLP